MKIQIQMGADSQANVHFVVQHGQTREMLEQAMPRLRDMLAGQGIQLGQTLVQQQPQQQSQGQSAFAGQGQQGQKAADLLPKQAKLRQRSRALACVCRRNRQTTAELISMLDASPSKFMISNKFETRVDKGWQTITN